MKLALISDTHGFYPALPAGIEAVIHAGDIGVDRGAIPHFKDTFYPWVERAGVPVYATFGNHDLLGETKRWPTPIPANLRFYVDADVVINGVRFWFSPWSNLFGLWSFMRTEEGLAERYAQIPDDTQVIVSHGPPYGFCDEVDERYLIRPTDNRHVGSKALTKRMDELRHLKLVVCGHIHGGYGQTRAGFVDIVNASHVDEAYRPVNAPIVFEL